MMRIRIRAVLVIAFTLTLGVYVYSRPLAAPPKQTSLARKGRDTLVIDGQWRFKTDPDKAGQSEGWEKAIPKDAKTTPIPALWDTDAAPGYTGVAWYWREFETPPQWKGQTVRLRFEAAAESAQVWLNGTRLGEHIGGATPFEFNITAPLHVGAKNLLTVRMESNTKSAGGLWQGVMLMAHDEAYLSDVYVQSDAHGRVTAATTLLNTSNNTGDATLEARIIGVNAPTKELKRTRQNLHLTPALNITNLLISIRGKDLQLWSPETPAIYAIQFVFRQGTDILDTQETQFGFREFGYDKGAITLNGVALILTALALRQERPMVVASAEDTDKIRNIFQRAKDAKVNVLYLDAPTPALLRLADEMGILIVEGARPNQGAQATRDELRDLILRDRSHPSILAWSLGPMEGASIQSLRQLDPSRFLLAGPPATPNLYPPYLTNAISGPLPAGLLPR
ncbi:MAG TPA: beta galactosidase jelly roll domain-containing protein [Chthonomonadaceae bacterium]|nr:beta galactosidase jelly roll domain-containing protein [Chthonomonadaceae bacterium]